MNCRRFTFFMAVGIAVFAACSVARAGSVIEQVLPFAGQDSVRIKLRINGAGSSPVQINATIFQVNGGASLWSGPIGSITPNGKPASIEKIIDHLSPQLWTIDSPKLYNLEIFATQDGKTIETQTVHFGFRIFETKDAHFLLNGHPIFLRGVAINPPGRGIPEQVCMSRKFAEDYVKYLRSQGVNLIRMNGDSQTWFDVCDEQGMMVFQGLYGSPPGGSKLVKGEADVPKDFDASMTTYRQTFESYVHHPSIVIYILSNELPYTGERGAAWHDFLVKACDYCKANIDSTRPYIGNAGYGDGHEGDLNDVHRYWAWYYNTYLTYYNVRDPKLFGDYEKNQPFTFSECVGNFTGPLGQYNLTFSKQLACRLGWLGATTDLVGDAQKYQGLVVQQAAESFRRLRDINPRICGLMPFTILFHNWNGISSFDQMKPTAALNQMSMSYSPVLLSWEMWTPNIYAGTKLKAIAHIVNDADDFSDLQNASIGWQLINHETKMVLNQQIPLPLVKYYGALSTPISIDLPPTIPTGEYQLIGEVVVGGKTIARNHTDLFIAGADWKTPPLGQIKKQVVLYDPMHLTAGAMGKLDIPTKSVSNLKDLQPNDTLVIGEMSADESDGLKEFIHAGGRVLCLAQDHAKFKGDWLPSAIEMFKTSSSDSEYSGKKRPTYDQMNVNPERPDHPVFAGLDRHRFWTWSDYTNWDETKPGFPQICPVTHGFKLTSSDSFAHTAILADYDRGLEGVALCEMFDGKGSVILTGLDLVNRIGVDPVADRMLMNLVSYASDNNAHQVHPLIDKPIEWGNLPTEHGVNTGPLTGLVYNCRWAPGDFTKHEKPMADNTGQWNTLPGEQFVTTGIRPFGPYGWTSGATPIDLNKESPTGSGEFWCQLPAGRTKMISKVQNPGDKPGNIEIQIDGKNVGESFGVAAGKTVTIETKLPAGASDISVGYKGEKQLVILETSFE